MRDSRRSIVVGLLALVGVACLTGCSRGRYRALADREVYNLVDEKSSDPRWALPGYNIEADPRSRYFEPFDQDHSPLPPDDPASHEFMHSVDGKKGYKHWHRDGDRAQLESPGWRERLGEYVTINASGAVKLDLDAALQLAYIHSPAWRQQLETIYQSALDVSTERFRFDTQFFGGTGATYTHNGSKSARARVIGVGPGGPITADRNTLTVNNTLQAQRRFATGGQLLVNFANSFVWQFAGPDSNTAVSLLSLNLVQPLLRAGGRAVALEQLTIAERALLANLRAMRQYQLGFYTNVAMGDAGTVTPQRRGGFFGGTGLTGFTGQGAGGFGGVGQATNFGGIGGAGGGTAGGAVAGAAGGGAGTVGGFIGLLQQQQQIRNIEDSLNLKLRTLGLLEANLRAGLIDLTQVDSFRQSIQTDRANLLQAQSNVENTLDTFKRQTLGLPPDLPIELDDSMIQQFQLIDRRLTAMQNRFSDFVRDFSGGTAEPTAADLDTAVDTLAGLRSESLQLFQFVKTDLERFEQAVPARLRSLEPEERGLFEEDHRRLLESFGELEVRLRGAKAQLDTIADRIGQQPDRVVANAIVALAIELADRVQELSIIEARARLETVDLVPVRLTPEVALEIARASRLDWMNNRASLVDSWRLITFNANALKSNVTVSLSGDISTVGDNPVKFRAPTGNMSAGLQFDPPLTRLLERNNYRSVLISYQQDRRSLIQFEDRISQSMRQSMRQLRQLEANLALQRSAVVIALRRVDQTRADLSAPTRPAEPGQLVNPLGPTASQNLISALTALSDSQNNFMSVWLNHYAQRMLLMREMGVMQLDERGRWIDAPLNEVLAQQGDACPLPPEVPADWLRDAGLDPDKAEAIEPGPGPSGQAPPAPRQPAPARPAPGPQPQPPGPNSAQSPAPTAQPPAERSSLQSVQVQKASYSLLPRP